MSESTEKLSDIKQVGIWNREALRVIEDAIGRQEINPCQVFTEMKCVVQSSDDEIERLKSEVMRLKSYCEVADEAHGAWGKPMDDKEAEHWRSVAKKQRESKNESIKPFANNEVGL